MFILKTKVLYKRDKQLRRVESVERADNILNAAKDKSDYPMVSLLSMENFKDKTSFVNDSIQQEGQTLHDAAKILRSSLLFGALGPQCSSTFYLFGFITVLI